MIKTFPLNFTDEQLEEIGKKAEELKMSKKEFILEAIKEKLEKLKGGYTNDKYIRWLVYSRSSKNRISNINDNEFIRIIYYK